MGREPSRCSARAGYKWERGLKLKGGDRERLDEAMRRGHMSGRTFKRGRVLQLLCEGRSCAAAAEAAGVGLKTAKEIKQRYRQRGLDGILKEQPRGKAERTFNDKQEQQLVAVLCGPSPTGRARWTIRTAAEEAVKRGIVPKVGRETIRVLIHNHALKPWREKNVVHPGVDGGVRRPDGESS